MPHFPKPVSMGPGCTRWRLSELEQYEAHVANDPTAPLRDRADDRYLNVRQVADRLGISIPTVWRWSRTGAGG